MVYFLCSGNQSRIGLATIPLKLVDHTHTMPRLTRHARNCWSYSWGMISWPMFIQGILDRAHFPCFPDFRLVLGHVLIPPCVDTNMHDIICFLILEYSSVVTGRYVLHTSGYSAERVLNNVATENRSRFQRQGARLKTPNKDFRPHERPPSHDEDYNQEDASDTCLVVDLAPFAATRSCGRPPKSAWAIWYPRYGEDAYE